MSSCKSVFYIITQLHLKKIKRCLSLKKSIFNKFRDKQKLKQYTFRENMYICIQMYTTLRNTEINNPKFWGSMTRKRNQENQLYNALEREEQLFPCWSVIKIPNKFAYSLATINLYATLKCVDESLDFPFSNRLHWIFNTALRHDDGAMHMLTLIC